MISFNSTSLTSLEILSDIDRAFTELDYPNFFSRKKKKGYMKSHVQSLFRNSPDFTYAAIEQDRLRKKVNADLISESKIEDPNSTLNDSRSHLNNLTIHIPKGNELVEDEMKVNFEVNLETEVLFWEFSLCELEISVSKHILPSIKGLLHHSTIK